MAIDLRPQDNFGARIMQALLAKESMALQQEDLKIRQGQFKLQQETAEFEQQRQKDVALGTALGLSVGRTEEQQAPVRAGLSALAGVPSVAPGGAALQQIGQAGQAALPTAESAIQQQAQGPFAAAAAGTALEGQRERAAGRETRRRTVQVAEAAQRETVLWHEVQARHQDRVLALEEEIKRATVAIQKAASDTAKSTARSGLIKTAITAADGEIARFTQLAELYGSAEQASLAMWDTAIPPSRGTILQRNLAAIDAFGEGDLDALARILAGPTDSDIGSRLGVHPAFIKQFEELQGQEEFRDVGNDEFLFELFQAIDATDDVSREWREDQKDKARRWLIGITGDRDLGRSFEGPQTQGSFTPRQTPAQRVETGRVLGEIRRRGLPSQVGTGTP